MKSKLDVSEFFFSSFFYSIGEATEMQGHSGSCCFAPHPTTAETKVTIKVLHAKSPRTCSSFLVLKT